MGFVRSESGFSAVELVVVIMVIAALILFLSPLMMEMITDARLLNVRQDAASIGAAIEILKLGGGYDPVYEGLYDRIREISGKSFDGFISDLRPDGGFVYSQTIGGVTYAVRYDAPTGSVVEGRAVGKDGGIKQDGAKQDGTKQDGAKQDG